MSLKSPLYISEKDIMEASNLKILIDDIRAAYFKPMDAEVPKRSLILRDDPFLAFVTMPAYSDAHGLFITKIGAVVPSGQNPSVRALVVAYSNQADKPVMLFDGAAITDLKCAAVSALITDICTTEHANALALIGSGKQAKAQIRGIATVRKLAQIRIYSRSPKNVANFIKKNKKMLEGIQVIACDTVAMALEKADIISTATTSIEPLFSFSDLKKQLVHINCMGAHTPHSSELAKDLLKSAAVIVEDIEMAIAEAGAINSHAISLSELMHLDPSVLKEKLTIFRSTGHAYLDLITTAHVMKQLDLLS